MGNDHSTDLQLKDLSPEDYKRFLDEEYTVIRTDGTIQPGWTFQDGIHYCLNSDGVSAHHRQASVTRESDNVNAYKFFMVFNQCNKSCSNGDHRTPCDHVCGWRACYPGKRTFWPTRLKTEDRAAWWAWVDGCIAYLETKSQTSINA